MGAFQWRIQDFPQGGANSQNCYYFSHFCRKLHENERIWTPRGGRVPGAPPWIRQWIHTCDSPNYFDYNAIHNYANSARNSSRLKNRWCELTLTEYEAFKTHGWQPVNSSLFARVSTLVGECDTALNGFFYFSRSLCHM